MKKSINKLNIAQIFFLLFLVSLFFPIRYVFPNQQAFQTGAYSDFTSISLYLSDIFLMITVLFLIFPIKAIKFKLSHTALPLSVLIIWLIISLFWHIKTISPLNIWFFVKYLELIVAYETALYLFAKTEIKLLFIRVFVILSSIESILAASEFGAQRSIGGLLHKLGEPLINPKILGIAKIVSGGTTYIRGYGTFPHPNLLSAFLAFGVLLSIYVVISSKSLKAQVFWNVTIFINILGVTMSFSRAAFLALAIAIVIFFGLLALKGYFSLNRAIKTALIIVTSSALICIIVFFPFLSTRATVSDSASLERIFYAKIGLRMIEQHPVFGVGIGESVLHMQQYSPIKLWPWQIQPVHNYFLLAAAELGIPGALILIWFFLAHLFKLIKKFRLSLNVDMTTYYLLLTTTLISFLLLMQFDHYFYTLQQTQMLLWVVLGIVAAEIKFDPKKL